MIGVSERSWILLFDMNCQISIIIIPHENQYQTDMILDLNQSPQLYSTTRLGDVFIAHTQLWESPTCVGPLMCSAGLFQGIFIFLKWNQIFHSEVNKV